MRGNYLLTYVRNDCINVAVFGLFFAVVSATPFWVSEDRSLQAAGAAGICCSFLALYLARHALFPWREGSVQALARYGPLPEVLDSLHREWASGTALKVGRTCLGESWLANRGVGVQVFRVDEITDVQIQQTRQRVNGIPAGSTWQLIITRRDGSAGVVHTPNEAGALQLLEALRARMG
jgi:hypothetical protein